MSTAFETLYSLAVDLWTNARFAHLTANHDPDRDRVERALRDSILALLMSDEQRAGTGRWTHTRVFCRNFVNRAQGLATDAEVQDILKAAEDASQIEQERLQILPVLIAERLRERRAQQLVDAVNKWVSQDPYPALGNRSYLDWFDSRWLYWQPKSVDQLDSEELLGDLAMLSTQKETQIKGIGLPLAANLFADTGLSAFCKPDLHVMPIVGALVFEDDERAVFKCLVDIAKKDAARLKFNHSFEWLNDCGGLMPRHLDRLIYLVGSDNLHLASDNRSLRGRKSKRHAPARRALAKRALIDAGLMASSYRSAEEVFKL